MMVLAQILQQLENPDQWSRVEALRILAMVEEIRALDAIRDVYHHDPEPGVRQVALWAGKIIYAAQKRTRVDAPESNPAQDRQALHESALIQSVINTEDYHIMQSYILQQQLEDELRAARRLKTGQLPSLPPANQEPTDDVFGKLS